MTVTINFNNIELNQYFRINVVNRDILPPQDLTTLTVPDRDGVYFVRNRLESRNISVQISIIEETLEILRQNVRDLAGDLFVRDPAPLIFSDEPDKTYFAIINGSTFLNEILAIGQSTINFFLADPLGYEDWQQEAFDVIGEVYPQVEGTYFTYPRFLLDFDSTTEIDPFTISYEGKAVILNRSFQAGDQLIVYNDENRVTLNGNSIMGDVDIDTTFFPLQVGQDGIVTFSENFDGFVYWRNRWL